MRITIPLFLDHETDADIIRYLDSMSPIARNIHVRQAIRDHMSVERSNTTVKELYNRVEYLITRLETSLASEIPILVNGQTVNLSTKISLDVDRQEMDEIFGNIDSIGEE